jgi:hypothetical protein
MATYRVLYWQEIPSQIVAEDNDGEVRVPMPPRFLERIDEVATERGLAESDDYLAPWKWSDGEDRDGSAEDVAAAGLAELDADAKW